MMRKKEYKIAPQAFLAWLGSVFFFLYQYILRIAPGLVEPELRGSFIMTANDFATLGSYFMLTYAIAQIPCGILVDKIGVKKVILTSIILCLFGNGLLVSGHSVWEAQLSRILMGLGASCSYICCLKIATDNFPGSLRGILMGSALAIGLLGPLLCATPLVKLIDVAGWQYTFTVLSAVGVILWFLLLLTMPKASSISKVKFDFNDVKKAIAITFQNKPILAYAVLTSCFYAPLAVIADLWGVSFLMNHFNMPRIDSANITMQIYVGAALSSLLLPWLCEKYYAYKITIIASWFGIIISLIFLLYGGKMPIVMLITTLICIGIFSSAEILCFSAASHHTTPSTSGTILSIVNAFSVIGSATMMQVVGYLLDARWNGQIDSQGLRIYSSDHYISALTSIIIFVVLGGVFAYILYMRGKLLHQKTVD